MKTKTQIYPSTVIEAIEYAKKKNPKDTQGFSAFRINMSKKRDYKLTSYIPFEINIPDKGWQSVHLKFFNLKHVGRILPLDEGELTRQTTNILNVSLLFKSDYEYERYNKKEKIIEPYGKVKDIICNAFIYHAKKLQKKQEFDQEAKIIPNVKHIRKIKKDGKYIIEKIDPANININLKFKSRSQENKLDPKTTFQCPILDVRYERKNRSPSEYIFDDAKLPDENGNLTIPINNGNIHKFICGGSLISGVEDIGAVCLSHGKISLPSSLNVCMVKPIQSFTTQDDFSEEDIDTIKNFVKEEDMDDIAKELQKINDEEDDFDDFI